MQLKSISHVANEGGTMKKFVTASFLLFTFSALALGEDTFSLHSLYYSPLGDTTIWRTSSGPRGVWSGSDLDQDGRQEIWAVDYTDGGKVHAFEWYYGDTLVHVWSSAPTNSGYSTGTRWVQTGDLDGDGLGEVIFFAGRDVDSDSLAGLYVYEWDGVTDNGYGSSPTWFRNLHTAFNDSLADVKVEHFSVGDIDGDGVQEIVWANNGPSNPVYGTVDGSTAYSEDRFIIASVSGDIGVLPQLNLEYAASPRDADKDGVRENKFGGGSPQGVVIADTDGDGKKEAVCFAWNNLSCFIIEATGPDAYTVSDTGYKMVTLRDDWTLAPTVADADGDGKDEVYVASFYTGIVYVVADKDGDATTFTSSEYAAIDTLGGYGLGMSASNNAFGDPALFVGKGSGFVKLDLTGTDVFDETAWTATEFSVDSNQTGGVNKMFAGANLDNDKFGEVVLAYQGVSDSLYAGTDSAMANPNRVFLRVLEWSGESSELAVKDVVLITPDQFKLNQNYPNPFNPTTTIEYTLPIASTISLTVYNMLGQEVVKLVNNENKPAGSYSVQWNGLDRNGVKVSSGTYFYTLKFGNFSKTKQMTFLK